jgi:hypothetical protein
MLSVACLYTWYLACMSVVRAWQHYFTSSESNNCQTSCFTTSTGAIQTVKAPIWFSTSSIDSFEQSKLSAINDTAWEHWYFEAFSDKGDVFVTSFSRDPSYRLFGQGVLRLELRFAWANGTSFGLVEFVDESTVMDCCGAVGGTWSTKNKIFSFLISADLKTATLDFDTPTLQGRVNMESVGPSRYPDGSIWPSRTASTWLSPHLHFTEALVAANVKVDLNVMGSPFRYSGHGGHNHLWAAFDWFTILRGWRLARGVVGPYAFSLWHTFSKTDPRIEYQSAMLLENGEPVFNAWTDPNNPNKSLKNHVVLRLNMGGKVHSDFLDQSTGWTIEFVAPETGNRWSFKLEHMSVAMDINFGKSSSATYFVDSVVGGAIVEEKFTGYALSEQTFFPEKLGFDFLYQIWSYFRSATKTSVLAALWATSGAILSDVVKTIAWRVVQL